uniref:hypothetical protein n=1 Tax=Streptomyces caniscabiei TaxID=2746961 RepID=UPI001C4E5446
GTGCHGAEEGGVPAVGKRHGQCGQQHDKDVAVAGFVAEACGAVVVGEILGQVGLYAFGAEGTGRGTSSGRTPRARGS